MPAVSISVPVYNAEKYLRRCLDSLVGQTFRDLEIIIVDDGSTDNSPAICDEYADRDPRVHVIHQANGGSASARQTALQHSQGEYTIACDSDDTMDVAMIERLYAHARAHNSDICFCNFRRDYADRQENTHYSQPRDNDEMLAQILTGRVHASLCNKLIRRRLYIDHDINFLPGLNMMEDVSVMFRLVYFAHTLSFIDEALYFYNKQNSTSYTTVFHDSYARQYIMLDRLITEFFSSHPTSPEVARAIACKRSGLRCSLLLHGSNAALQTHSVFLRDLSVAPVISHPNLPLHYKAIGVAQAFHAGLIVKLLRYLYKKLR